MLVHAHVGVMYVWVSGAPARYKRTLALSHSRKRMSQRRAPVGSKGSGTKQPIGAIELTQTARPGSVRAWLVIPGGLRSATGCELRVTGFIGKISNQKSHPSMNTMEARTKRYIPRCFFKARSLLPFPFHALARASRPSTFFFDERFQYESIY